MHYKDGTEAKVGDFIRYTDHDGEQVAVLRTINAQSDTCNGVAGKIISKPTVMDAWVTLKDCELIHRPKI